MRVGSISTCSNPADTSLSRYSFSSSAPATQPTHRRMFCRICGSTSPRVTTSETASRPPGLSTRNASRNTASLSAERLITQFEMITSTELSGNGMCSISPLKNSTFSATALRLFSFASASISSVISNPYAFPVGPTRFAESKTSMPPPEPRSRTTSPGFNLASAVGFPQPSEACSASPGICSFCAASYRLEVIGSQLFRLQRLVPRAAFRVQELQKFLQRFRVRRVAQERTLSLHVHEPFILQLVEMMRQRRIGNLQFPLDVPNHQSLGMRRQQQLHDPEPRLRPHRREHIGILRYALCFLSVRFIFHISIIAEIWMTVNPNLPLDFLLICDILNVVDNYVSTAGACSRFSFFQASLF